MKSIYEIEYPSTLSDVLTLFQLTIRYRETHKEESEKIARFVFDATHESKTGIRLDQELEMIRYEFGALEAPGTSEVSIDSDYTDSLWHRLSLIVDNFSQQKSASE